MDLSTYLIRIVGQHPGTIMHSTRGMIDSDKRVIALRQLVKRTTASKRTEAETNRIAQLETELSIYWDDGQPILPAANIRAAIEKGARTLKDGPRVRRGLTVDSVAFHSDDYPAGASIAEIVEATRFVSPVKVGRSTVMRTRALFKSWRADITIKAMDDMVDAAALKRWFTIAGNMIGIGDWRPDCSGSHGKFDVVSVERVSDGG